MTFPFPFFQELGDWKPTDVVMLETMVHVISFRLIEVVLTIRCREADFGRIEEEST